MRRLEVLLPAALLDEVRESLAGIGVEKMTLADVRVVDPANRRREVFRGSEYIVDFAVKVRLGLVVEDALLPAVVDALRTSLGPEGCDESEVILSEAIDVLPLGAAGGPSRRRRLHFGWTGGVYGT